MEDMAFSESLAGRIRDALARKKNIEEKKMFGGVGFLFNGNMLVGVWKNYSASWAMAADARRRC